jgi:hypothetical protein
MLTKVVYIHLNKPYDVYQKEVNDPEILPNVIDSISFTQDIFIPSIEGELVISDFMLYDLLPLAIDDKIRIYTINPIYDSISKTLSIGKDYYTEFRILSAEPITSEPDVIDKDNIKQFRLRIIDDKSFDGYLFKKSDMYIDKDISEIVKDVIQPIWKLSKEIKINQNISKDKYNLTLPHWEIYKQLNYLTKFTEFADGSGCVYYNSLPIYYENGQSEYNFNYTNISALFKNDEEFIDEEYSITGDINRTYNIFLQKDNNYFQMISQGVNINNVKIIDIKRNKLNKIYPYNDIEIDKYSCERIRSFWELNYENNYLMKNVITNNIKIYCTVSGDYKRKIGTVIKFRFPSSFDSYNKNDYLDERLSGKYLIKTIQHVFIKNDDHKWVYNQKLGLITDGYNK